MITRKVTPSPDYGLNWQMTTYSAPYFAGTATADYNEVSLVNLCGGSILSAVWEGTVRVPTTGSWTFKLAESAWYGYRFSVDGVKQFEAWPELGADQTQSVTLTAGGRWEYPIKMEFSIRSDWRWWVANVNLKWPGPGIVDQLVPAVLAAGPCPADTVTTYRYVYDGWNLVAEMDDAGSAPKTYAWGSDLSGSLQGAGGIGGLLFATRPVPASTATYAPAFDGNGNVAGYVDLATGSQSALYEYNAFGETVIADGPAKDAFPFRFSTKFNDAESGLLYYGLRYYSPTLGRFINQDPISEKGGLNLYGFCGNNGVNRWDYLGMVMDQETLFIAGDDAGEAGTIYRNKAQVYRGDPGNFRPVPWGAPKTGLPEKYKVTFSDGSTQTITARSAASAWGKAYAGTLGDQLAAGIGNFGFTATITTPGFLQSINTPGGTAYAFPAASTSLGNVTLADLTDPTFQSDDNFDFGSASARNQLDLGLLDIQLREIRSRESTAYDWDIAVDYIAKSGGVRGLAANATMDAGNGPTRLTGGVGVSATIDDGFGASYSGGFKGTLPNGEAATVTFGQSWSQLRPEGRPQLFGISYTAPFTSPQENPALRLASGWGEGLPDTVTVGLRYRVGRVNVNVGVVVNPGNVYKNLGTSIRALPANELIKCPNQEKSHYASF